MRNCFPIVLWFVDQRYLRKNPRSPFPWPGSCASLIALLVPPPIFLVDGGIVVVLLVLEPGVVGRARPDNELPAHLVVAQAAKLRAGDLEDADAIIAVGPLGLANFAVLKDARLGLQRLVKAGD